LSRLLIGLVMLIIQCLRYVWIALHGHTTQILMVCCVATGGHSGGGEQRGGPQHHGEPVQDCICAAQA